MPIKILCSILDKENMTIKMTSKSPSYINGLGTIDPPVNVSINKGIKVDVFHTLRGGSIISDHDLSSVESKNPIPSFGHSTSNKIKIIPRIYE